jgi:hypothetical protein
MPTSSHLPICPLCNEPVELETAKTDENGNAVHEECYTLKVQPERSKHIAISPVTLECPRCGAQPGNVCELFDSKVEVVHIERIAAAKAMGDATKK